MVGGKLCGPGHLEACGEQAGVSVQGSEVAASVWLQCWGGRRRPPAALPSGVAETTHKSHTRYSKSILRLAPEAILVQSPMSDGKVLPWDQFCSGRWATLSSTLTLRWLL